MRGAAGLDIPDVRLVIHWQQSASAEDLLQDVGRLRFMAEKTVETAPLNAQQKSAMLDQRTRQIEQVSRMLRSKSCFRASIRDYVSDGSARQKLSFAERILEWVFGTRAPPMRCAACCDHCDAELIEKHGTLIYLAWIVGGDLSRGEVTLTSSSNLT